jgi:hypothetical protein
MNTADLALVITVTQTVAIFINVAIVCAVFILFLQSGAIVRLMSSLLTLQVITHLSLVTFGMPSNMEFQLAYLKTVVTFEGLLGNLIGMQKFVDVTRTAPFNDFFKRAGYSSQALIINMGVLCSFFMLICLQMLTLLMMNLMQNFFKSNRTMTAVGNMLGKIILPQVMYFMMFAFFEILICVCVSVVPNGKNN